MNRKTLAYDAILAAAAISIYLPSLRYGFIGDDLIYFIGNPFIRSFDVLTILRSGAIGADYLPLRDLSFAFDYLLWGENPFGFHLTNVLLYGLTAVSVKHLFVSLNAYFTRREDELFHLPAFFAASVFALHPFHREVVCAVFNRGTLLTTLFCVLACISYLRHLRVRGGYGSYILALFAAVLALLSREYGIILPFLLTLIVLSGDRESPGARFAELLPFYFIGAVFFLVYREVASAANFIVAQETLLSDFPGKAATAFRIIIFYLVRMFTFTGRLSVTEGAVFATVAGALTTTLLASFVRVRRAHPQLLFGFAFFLVGLLPVLNFYRTMPVVAVRYAYLPGIGLFFMLTAIPFQGWKRAVPVGALAATAVFLLTTTYQARYYENNINYWEFIASCEQNGMVYEQLGFAYLRDHQYAKAREALRKAAPKPFDPVYQAAVGDACLNLGDYPCAVEALETAVMLGAGDRGTIDLLARARRMQAGKAPPANTKNSMTKPEL